jgi:hypothetical protein
MNMTELIRDLWKEVFIAAIRAGCGEIDAETKADYAVRKFRQNFG